MIENNQWPPRSPSHSSLRQRIASCIDKQGHQTPNCTLQYASMAHQVASSTKFVLDY